MNTKSLTILITEQSTNVQLSVKRFFDAKGVKIVFADRNGRDVLCKIAEEKPDVVVLEPFLSELDAIEVKRRCDKDKLTPKLFLAAGAFDNDKITVQLLNEGFDYYFIKPYSNEVLLDRIKFILGINILTAKPVTAVEYRAEEILRLFCIPAHLNGFKYLVEAIVMSVKHPEILNNITKDLYPELAKINDTTASRVERAVRHAIHTAWERNGAEVINEYFPYMRYSEKGKPTNKEFIQTVSDRIKREVYGKKTKSS